MSLSVRVELSLLCALRRAYPAYSSDESRCDLEVLLLTFGQVIEKEVLFFGIMTINSPRTNGRLPGTGRTNGSGRFSFPERFLLQTIRRDGVVGARVGADARVRAAIPRLRLRHTTTRGTYRFEHP